MAEATKTESNEDTAGPENNGGSAAVAVEKTLTQSQVDAIVTDRIARERKKYADYDELKSKASAFEAAEAEKMTELDKHRRKAEEAEARAEKLESNYRKATLNSMILAEAGRANRNVVDPEGALAFLTGADSDLLELDTDGTPVNMTEAMDKLLERRSYLVADRKSTPGADQGARGGDTAPGQITEAELDNMTPSQIVKARQEGRLASLLGS